MKFEERREELTTEGCSVRAASDENRNPNADADEQTNRSKTRPTSTELPMRPEKLFATADVEDKQM